MKVTKRILVDVPAPIQLSGTHSLGSPSTAGPGGQAHTDVGPRGGSSLGVESQATLSSGPASPMNSSISAQSLSMLGKPLVASPVVPKPRPLATDAASRNSSPGGPILGTTLYRVDDQQSTMGTTFTISSTARHSTGSTQRVTQLIDEDVTTPSFFFRNISILQLPETAELGTKVGDAEHVLRSQCVFVTALLYELIRARIYDPSKQYVGILGCGRLGRLIVGSLLDLGWPPETLLVCTRDLDKVTDLKAQGVVCTNRHAAMSGVPLVILCVSPINLREVKEQMSGVLRPETLLVSLLAGVTCEKLMSVFNKHDLLLRTVADMRCFPAPWSKQGQRRAANDFLGFEVRTYSDYLDQAAKHMVAAPGYIENLLAKMRLYAHRLDWDEPAAETLLQSLLFGKSLSSIMEGDEGEQPDDEADGRGVGLVDLADLPDLKSRYCSYNASITGHSLHHSHSTGMSARAGSSGIMRRHQRGLLHHTSSSSLGSATTTPRGAGAGGPLGSLKSLNKEVASFRPGRGVGKSGGKKRSVVALEPFAEHAKFEKLEQSVNTLVLPAFQRVLSEWAKEQQRQKLLLQQPEPSPAASSKGPSENLGSSFNFASSRNSAMMSSFMIRDRGAEGVLSTLGASYNHGDAMSSSFRAGGWKNNPGREGEGGDDDGGLRGTLRTSLRGGQGEEGKDTSPLDRTGTRRTLAGYGTDRSMRVAATSEGEETAPLNE